MSLPSLAVQYLSLFAAVTLTFNSNGLPGIAELNSLMGGVGVVMEILALFGLVVSAGIWAVSHHYGNIRGTGYGKVGVITSIAAAFLIGGAAAIINFFLLAGAKV